MNIDDIEPTITDWQNAEAIVNRALEPRAHLSRHYDFQLRRRIAQALAWQRERSAEIADRKAAGFRNGGAINAAREIAAEIRLFPEVTRCYR